MEVRPDAEAIEFVASKRNNSSKRLSAFGKSSPVSSKIRGVRTKTLVAKDITPLCLTYFEGKRVLLFHSDEERVRKSWILDK